MYAAAWNSGTIVAVSAMNYTNYAKLLLGDLGLNGTSVSATVLGRVYGNMSTYPQIQGDAVTDQLQAYSVRVYIVT